MLVLVINCAIEKEIAAEFFPVVTVTGTVVVSLISSNFNTNAAFAVSLILTTEIFDLINMFQVILTNSKINLLLNKMNTYVMLTALLETITISTGSPNSGNTDFKLIVSCRRPKLTTTIYVGLFAKYLIRSEIEYSLCISLCILNVHHCTQTF